MHLQEKAPRGGSAGDAGLGPVPIVLMFVIASIGNLIVALLGTSPISVFLVGEVIVGLFLFDFLRTKILMHVYQILLIYFYFSLVVFHSFNDTSAPYYFTAYIINSLHFLFFTVGYQLIATKNVVRPVVTPKQNVLTLIYIGFGLILSIYTLWIKDYVVSYNSTFLSFEEATSRPIYKIYLSSVVQNMWTLIIYLTSHPIVLSISYFFSKILSYPLQGIKGPLLMSFLIVIFVTQIYISRFSFRWLLVVGILGACLSFFLIGSTNFRLVLSIESLFNAITDMDTVVNRWRYFIMESPESSHIRYTADILRMIENEMTDFRYGYDYYRFFLYPIKSLFDDFQFASYNQYPVLLSGYNVSMGLYLGLAGELFWNFGWVFPVFSLAYGYSLKWFTNFAFSGSFFGFVLYIILFKTMVWHLYRGEANAVMISVSALAIGVIIVRLSLQIKQVRMIAVYMSKFVVKRPYRGRVDYDG